eukprot:351612-Chlamydomonas_euryale.AAC.30
MNDWLGASGVGIGAAVAARLKGSVRVSNVGIRAAMAARVKGSVRVSGVGVQGSCGRTGEGLAWSCRGGSGLSARRRRTAGTAAADCSGLKAKLRRVQAGGFRVRVVCVWGCMYGMYEWGVCAGCMRGVGVGWVWREGCFGPV